MGRKYSVGDVRDINSMEELHYHKLRLELATEFLEDKIEDNIGDIKNQLKPRNLFRTLLTTVFSFFGRRHRSHENDDDETDDGEGDNSMMVDGIVALSKAFFRSR